MTKQFVRAEMCAMKKKCILNVYLGLKKRLGITALVN